jgi:hypothetical protein
VLLKSWITLVVPLQKIRALRWIQHYCLDVKVYIIKAFNKENWILF